MKLLMAKIHEIEEDCKKLIEENQKLKDENLKLSVFKEASSAALEAFEEFRAHLIPVQVYHHKKRGNTTVVFADNSSVTVKRMKGDKDCIETAIVYALAKHYISSSGIKRLVKDLKEAD